MGGIDSTQSAPAGYAARAAEIARVVARVQPVVEAILARARRVNRLSREDVDDVRSAVMLRMVRRLQGDGIDDLEAYAAALTRNALHDVMRSRHPERARLKNRLRFLLAHDPRFATWIEAGTRVCGLAEWRGRRPLRAAVSADAVSLQRPGERQPGEALLRVLQHLDGPVELDELVSLLMDWWHVVESVPVDADPATLLARVPSQLEHFEQRERLEQLWREIAALRPMQRTALLLNLRDHQGGNALLLLLVLEIADFDSLAAALGTTAEELASLWNQLPLDDLTIAARLGVGRQKVINLRKSARERLTRRLSP